MYKHIDINPFNNSKYNFVIENSVDLKDSFIQYAEMCIDRAKHQIKLSNELNSIDHALKIELSIFEYTLIYCLNNKYNENYVSGIYDDKFNFIMSNLNENSKHIENKTFKKYILDGKIDATTVAFLSPPQVHPAKWANILKKKEYIDQREKNIAYSDAYKCFKCGESKCKITQMQTRSADEPMTTFVACLVCQNVFTFG
jgi:DNA-directed RNA polymerase subunit M/transcription elongation factor TFIIS